MSHEETTTGGEVPFDVMAARQAFLDTEAEWLRQQIHIDHPERYGIPVVRLTGANRGVVVGSWGNSLREYEVENFLFTHHTNTPPEAAEMFADGEYIWRVASQASQDEEFPLSPRTRRIDVALGAADVPARVRVIEDDWYFGAPRALYEELESIGLVRDQYRRIGALRDVYGGDLVSLHSDLVSRYSPDGDQVLSGAISHAVGRMHNDMEALRLEADARAWICARFAGGNAVGEAAAV